MKVIPVIKCKNMEESIFFYTQVLDFELKDPTDESPVRDLVKGEAEIQLSILSGDGVYGTAVNVRVDNIDELFKKYVERGLDTNKPGSPVHQGPLDQDWGMREFYADDPSGNTLRFGKPIW
jgi:catechol 2,3-dioxygenase-like lactoylglutathione lyase family enzyme